MGIFWAWHLHFLAFFASVFNGKTSSSSGFWPSELEDKDREQNEAPVIKGEVVRDLLHYLNAHTQGY